MGLTSGKYDMRNGNGREEILPSLSMKLSGSKKEKEFLPQCIRQNCFNDSSWTSKDDSTIVWIDIEINRLPSNIDIQIKLKNLINSLRIFDQLDAFERYIERIRQINEEKLLIIISPTLALTIIPHVHHHDPIQYIYIYGKAKIDEKIKEELFKRYPKVLPFISDCSAGLSLSLQVKGIFSKSRYLLAQINEDKNSNNNNEGISLQK